MSTYKGSQIVLAKVQSEVQRGVKADTKLLRILCTMWLKYADLNGYGVFLIAGTFHLRNN